MKPMTMFNKLPGSLIIFAAVLTSPALSVAQTPAPLPNDAAALASPTPAVAGTPAAADATAIPAAATPFAAAAPGAANAPATALPAAPEPNSPAWQALEPVRQAIAQRDYATAQQALQRAKQIVPNDPAIVVYDSLIRSGLNPETAVRQQNLIRTPIPGVTPLPIVTPAATPIPTATPATAEVQPNASANAYQAATEEPGNASGAVAKLKELWENPIAQYVVYGVVGLIVLLLLLRIFRKKKSVTVDHSEQVTPVPGSLQALGGMDDFSGGLSDSMGSFDPNAGAPGFDFSAPAETDFSAMNDTGAGGAALGGSMAAAPEFTAFGFEEEEPQPKPVTRPKPAPQLEDDSPVSLHDETPTVILHDTGLPPANAPENLSGGSDVTFESLGLSSPAPKPAAPSAPAAAPGNVNLDDIFGDQGIGSSASPAAEDPNSQTMPTFVSAPGASNPEENIEVPPQNQRSTATSENDQSISFEELFGSTSTTTPAVNPTPAPAPPTASAAPATSGSDLSIEDALAATLGAMQSASPDEKQEPAPTAASATPSGGTETLDERTERMFREQMAKARQAVDAKDWKQAVHVLSIASALHPENEEARQMLRDARAEKRKSEESV